MENETPHFNYRDTDAVAMLAKHVMREAGNVDVDEKDAKWSSNDEKAWAAYCDKHGGKYTSFPDINNQPDNIIKAFNHATTHVESKPSPVIEEKPNFQHLMIDPIKRDETGKLIPIDDHVVKKRNDSDEVNWAMCHGSMAQHGTNEQTNIKKVKEVVNRPRQKLQPTIHSKGKDGKAVAPTKEMIEKVANPEFDASHPPHNSQTDALIAEAEQNSTNSHEPKVVKTNKMGNVELVVR